MSGDPYKLWVEFRVSDQTYAGFSQLKKSIASSAESVAALKKELESVRTNSMVPASAIAARKEMLALATREASLREELMLSTDAGEKKILATKIEALQTVRQQLGLQREALAIQEQSAAAEARAAAAAERRAVADAKAAASARAAAFRAIGGGITAAGHAGTNMMWTGSGILAGAAYATQKAADFNQTTFQTDLALGGYNRTAAQRDADMRAIQKAAFTASDATGFFSAQQIMEGLQVAATSGMRPIVEKYGMSAFTGVAPALAQYMDITGRLKGEDAATAARQAIQTAHLFGAYTPEAMQRVWNQSAILSMAMPDEMSRAMTVMGQIGPVAQYLAGVSPAEIMAFTATADQSGLGQGRAGARLKDYIEAITVKGSPKVEAAKRALGLSAALDAKGNLELNKSFEILQADRARMSEQQFRDLASKAFLKQGVIPAAMFADPSKSSMYQQNLKVIQDAANNGSLAVIQNFLKSFGITGQEAIAVTRLSNDLVQFGQYGLPIATKFFDEVNPKLKEFGDWITEHPDDARQFFDNAVHIGEGLLIVGASLKSISMAWAAINAIGAIAKGIGVLKVAMGGEAIGAEASEAALGIKALGFAFSRLSLPLAAVVSLIYEIKDIRDMLDRKKRGERVTQADYDNGSLSPAGYGENQPGSLTYIGWRVGMPNPHGWTPQASLMNRLKAQPITIQAVHFNLPHGTSEQQGEAAMQHLLNLTGQFAPHPNAPNPHTVGGSNLVFGT